MKLSSTQRLTLGAMAAALTTLMLYATYAIPYVKFACLFLSSVFVYSLLCEGLYGWGFLVYLASAGIGFLIVPEKLYWALYVGLLGHYGIFKVFIDTHVTGRVLRSALKLAYCNLFALGGIAVMRFVLGFELPNALYIGETALPIWLAVFAAEAVFLIYDWVYTLCAQLYEVRIKPAILPKT